MTIFSKLRHAVTGLCLLAGMTSAQAALTIHFEENAATGILTVYFGGEQAAPSLTMEQFNVRSDQLMTAAAIVLNPGGYQAQMPNWVRTGDLPWRSANNISAISHSGTGGLYSHISNGIDPEDFTSNEIYSADANGSVVWDAIASYNAALETLQLTDGTSGSFSFTNGTDTITVDWSAVIIPIPEPATYAAVLGLGIAGFALLRRRMSRR